MFQSFRTAEKTFSLFCINHIQMLNHHTRKNCSSLSWNTKDEKTHKWSDGQKCVFCLWSKRPIFQRTLSKSTQVTLKTQIPAQYSLWPEIERKIEKVYYFDYLLEQKEWHVTHPSASRYCMNYASWNGTAPKIEPLGRSAYQCLATEAIGLTLRDQKGWAICMDLVSGEPRCFRPVPSQIYHFFSLYAVWS